MRLPQGEALVGGVRDRLQGVGLVGEGVPWRRGRGRGVLEEVDAVEFPSSSSSLTWGRGRTTTGRSARGREDSFYFSKLNVTGIQFLRRQQKRASPFLPETSSLITTCGCRGRCCSVKVTVMVTLQDDVFTFCFNSYVAN